MNAGKEGAEMNPEIDSNKDYKILDLLAALRKCDYGDETELHEALMVLCNIVAQQQCTIDTLTNFVAKQRRRWEE